MGIRKFVLGFFLLLALVISGVSVIASLPVDASSMTPDALVPLGGSWPVQVCRQDSAGLPEDQRKTYQTACAESCAKVLVHASEQAHQFWEKASETRFMLLFVPIVLAWVSAELVLVGLLRSRRLWGGLALGISSLTMAFFAGALALSISEARVGSMRSLRIASSVLLRIQEDKLWETERSCASMVAQAEHDPYDPFATQIGDYRGLGADFATGSLPDDPAARSDTIRPKLIDIQVAMKSLRVSGDQTWAHPPSSEPAIYDAAPHLLAGARSHRALAFFGPILGRSIFQGWAGGLLLQAFVLAIAGWGLCLLRRFAVHRRHATRHRASG